MAKEPLYKQFGWTCPTCTHARFILADVNPGVPPGKGYCRVNGTGFNGYPPLPKENGCDDHARVVQSKDISKDYWVRRLKNMKDMP